MVKVKLTRHERFKEIRESKGFARQKDVANITDVSTTLISSLENENSNRDVGISSIIKLADLYGVSIDWLFCRSETKSPKAEMGSARLMTGLSERTILAISELTKNRPAVADILELLFCENVPFLNCLDYLCNYQSAVEAEKICEKIQQELWSKETEDDEDPDDLSPERYMEASIAVEKKYEDARIKLFFDESIPNRVKDQLLLQHRLDHVGGDIAKDLILGMYSLSAKDLARGEATASFTRTLDVLDR